MLDYILQSRVVCHQTYVLNHHTYGSGTLNARLVIHACANQQKMFSNLHFSWWTRKGRRTGRQQRHSCWPREDGPSTPTSLGWRNTASPVMTCSPYPTTLASACVSGHPTFLWSVLASYTALALTPQSWCDLSCCEALTRTWQSVWVTTWGTWASSLSGPAFLLRCAFCVLCYSLFGR